jgi:acyl-CoA reductase-like NAD-dependent aldehyde dehydrogenase
VLAQVDNSMRVAQEEIFGPVVTVIPFEDEKDATRIANDVRYGLMATVWTGDPAAGHRLARRIKAGTVGINMPFTAFPASRSAATSSPASAASSGSRRSTPTSRRRA